MGRRRRCDARLAVAVHEVELVLENRVAAGPTGDRVALTVARVDPVVAGAALDPVAAGSAHEDVVAEAAQQLVVAPVAEDAVCAGEAL